MPTDDQGRLLVDIDQFTSREHAIERIKAVDSSGDSVIETMAETLRGAPGITLLCALLLSAIARVRGLQEGIVREIEHEDPHAVFGLLRELLETATIIAYTADRPAYVEALVRRPEHWEPGMLKRKTMKALIDYLDRKHSWQLGFVYNELSEVVHFGSPAVWGSFQIVSEEERETIWTNRPSWASDRDMYIVCAQYLELAEMARKVLHDLAEVCTETYADLPFAEQTSIPLTQLKPTQPES